MGYDSPMNRPGCQRRHASEQLNFALAALSIIAATLFQLWQTVVSVPITPSSESRRITDPGHINAVYQGMILAHSGDNVTNFTFDPNFNAGEAMPLASDGAGRIASLLFRITGGSLSDDHYRWCQIAIASIIPFLIA